MATIRKKRNEITRVKDENGFRWFVRRGLEQVFVRDFKKCFSCDIPPSNDDLCTLADIIQPCISSDHNKSLSTPISDDGIWDVVNGIGDLKAPSPDGLSAGFFHGCWDQIKDFVFSLIKKFFNNRTSLRLINHTNIALIPKIDNPETVSNYRPISLCNVSYKIITKIIIKHLKPLLDLCITQNQGAFVPGRTI